MTATFSSKAFPFRNGLRVIKQNQKFAIVTCILELLGVPLIVASIMLQLIRESRITEEYIDFLDTANTGLYAGIGSFCLTVSVIMGMFSAIHSFTELHSKPKVDMLYALPLTGTQRFFSDYLGGLGFYGLPYLISCIIGLAEIFLFGNFIDFDSSLIDEGLTLGMITKYYLYATIGLFALMLMYYTLSALVTVCCGTLFESIYTNFLLNCLIPGAMAAVMAVVTSNTGFEFEYLWQIIGYLSPVGGLIFLFYMLGDNLDDAMNGYLHTYGYGEAHATQTTLHQLFPTYIRWIFCIFLITAIMLIGAWQLYKRRKAEAVGQPFVYVGAYYLMLTLVTVSILCLMDVNVVGPALLFSAIVYFIMEVVRKRGFKKFWLSMITYVVTVGVTIGFFYLSVGTNLFGRVNYVPAPATVSSVQVEFSSKVYDGFEINLEYTDRDIIKAVTEQHKALVSVRKNDKKLISHNVANFAYNTMERQAALSNYDINEKLREQKLMKLYYNQNNDEIYLKNAGYSTGMPDYYYTGDDRQGWDERTWAQIATDPDKYEFNYVDTTSLEITYYTITGSTIHRRYLITPDELIHFSEIFMGTSLYGEAMENLMNYRTEEQYSEYDNKVMSKFIPSTIQMNLYYDPEINCNRYSNYESNKPSQSKRVNGGADALKHLASVYRQDIENTSPESMRTAKLFGMICGVPIYENYTNTIELLKSWGFTDFTLAQRYRTKALNEYNSYYNDDVNFLSVRIYAPDSYSASSAEFPHATVGTCYVKDDAEDIPTYEDVYYDAVNNTQLETSYPELYKLLEVAQPRYITTDTCYAVVVNGVWYIVPSEYSELAENVIKLGSHHFSGLKPSAGGSTPSVQDDTYFDGNSYTPSFGSF